MINYQNSNWKTLVNKLIDTDKLFKTGSDYINIAVYNLNNTFWRDTLFAFQNIQDKMKIQTWKEFITQPRWFNKNITIGNKSLFFNEWFKKNILFISDLLVRMVVI